VTVTAYGLCRELRALSYEVVWPTVLGLRVIRVVVVRDPNGKMRDAYLFSTDLKAGLVWVIETFAARWSIEVLFRASKQVMDIEAPQHWSQSSVEKLAPWVWSVQSVVMVWYLTVGHQEAEAKELADIMGPWDSDCTFRYFLLFAHSLSLFTLFDPAGPAVSTRHPQQAFGQDPKLSLGRSPPQHRLDFLSQHLALQCFTTVRMRWPPRLIIPRALLAIH
jgi:hypothetical protein